MFLDPNSMEIDSSNEINNAMDTSTPLTYIMNAINNKIQHIIMLEKQLEIARIELLELENMN